MSDSKLFELFSQKNIEHKHVKYVLNKCLYSRKEVLVSEIISVMFQSRKKAGKLTCQSVFKGQMVVIVYHCNYRWRFCGG